MSRAQALVNALPADQTTGCRKQLAELRKRFAARKTPVAKKAAQAKAPAAPEVQQEQKKQAGQKQAQKPAPRKAAPKSVFPDLGNRYINRATLGYSSEPSATNLTKGTQPSRATAKGGRDKSLESRT
ncbi:hypothetical protein GCM10009549_01610 [Streptomyces thermoalcalitolerans]|uniref:Uncharacterized protein n=1 Tax=Streptomyces thermoalcalitolerans TaxID=65605 RepID=A0ABN1NBI9_9ACTN